MSFIYSFVFTCSSLCQTSAESALELNGTDMDDGHKMSVYISNPERKKERTDSDANDREVYVAGLSKMVTKEDLENVFKTVSHCETYLYRILTGMFSTEL